jgi:EmrB/QacA subfamily drug resistance transporter
MSDRLAFRDALRAVLGVALVVVMVAIDQTVVSTALPVMVADLGGFEYYAWVGTAYMLMSVIAIPIFGRLGDYYGRKPFVAAAIVVFTLASIACAFAGSMFYLVLGRALQGIGGGMLVGTAFATIPDLFPEAKERLRWQVIISSAFGVANAIGPSLGGFLSHAYGWRSVFYVNVPIGLLCLGVVLRYLPRIRHHDTPPGRIDWLGAGLLAVILGSVQFLLQLAPHRGLGPLTLGLGAALAASVAGLVWCERRCAHPLLPLQMFTDRVVGSLSLLALLTGFAMFTMLFYVPLMFQGGFGMSAHDSGLLITPLVVSITFGSILNGQLVTRVRAANTMLYVGFVLLCLSFAAITLSGEQTPRSLLGAFMVCGGLGLGFIMPNLTIFAQDAVPRTQLGIVTGTLQSLRMIGGMLGTAAVGTLVTELYRDRVAREAAARGAAEFAAALGDPQVLVSPAAQERFMQAASAAAADGGALVETARDALVSAIHAGQAVGLLVALIALGCVRIVPRIDLGRRRRSSSSS